MDDKPQLGGNADKFNPGRGGWQKSSYSMSNGQCVETARLVGGRVGVRDSMAAEGLGAALRPGNVGGLPERNSGLRRASRPDPTAERPPP